MVEIKPHFISKQQHRGLGNLVVRYKRHTGLKEHLSRIRSGTGRLWESDNQATNRMRERVT